MPQMEILKILCFIHFDVMVEIISFLYINREIGIAEETDLRSRSECGLEHFIYFILLSGVLCCYTAPQRLPLIVLPSRPPLVPLSFFGLLLFFFFEHAKLRRRLADGRKSVGSHSSRSKRWFGHGPAPRRRHTWAG